jgi:hypothetical protein
LPMIVARGIVRAGVVDSRLRLAPFGENGS